MTTFRAVLLWTILVVTVCGVITFVIINWSWVFAKHIHGEIIDVQRVTNPTAIMGKVSDQQIHSYAILIQNDDDKKLYTARSDDQQWQVARRGYCVDALLYVYPPWNLEKSGTYFGARMNQMILCPGKTAPPESETKPSPDPLEPAR